MTHRELDLKAYQFIRNRLLHENRTTTVRELQAELGLSSPGVAGFVIDRLIKAGMLERGETGRGLRLKREPTVTIDHHRTVPVPVVGTAACGLPLLAEQNITDTVQVSTQLAKPGSQYFFLRANGNSMNKAKIPIADRSLVLVRRTETAHNGDLVVALINDEATIKELRRTGEIITLIPHSTDRSHQAIMVTEDFQVQGIVVDAFPPNSLPLTTEGSETTF